MPWMLLLRDESIDSFMWIINILFAFFTWGYPELICHLYFTHTIDNIFTLCSHIVLAIDNVRKEFRLVEWIMVLFSINPISALQEDPCDFLHAHSLDLILTQVTPWVLDWLLLLRLQFFNLIQSEVPVDLVIRMRFVVENESVTL